MTDAIQLMAERLRTPLGVLVLTHDGERLCNAEFANQEARRERELARHFPNAQVARAKEDSIFTEALARYFRGDLHAIDSLPVAKLGTAFQQRAWAALRRIPAGETRGYGAQARALGCPSAARAVGRANGLNPISIVVPCHRLVGADGGLVHYGGGVERKRWLIDHEARYANKGATVSEAGQVIA